MRPANAGGVTGPHPAPAYPPFRYMGSKQRLLPWIRSILVGLRFDSALDPFCGAGSVAYLLKTLGKRVVAADYLGFPATLARALVANSQHWLDADALERLWEPSGPMGFIEQTFSGIFFTPEDLRFLDRVSGNLARLAHSQQRDLALAALFRACLKRQPRGVFTLSGDLSRYDDGRRDLRLSLEQHFLEQVPLLNQLIFDNGQVHQVFQSDVFDLPALDLDLVYLDPPYVPRSDDNCYIKRYHFLEGLSCYWQGLTIDYATKVRKIPKRHTPFSYRRDALDAFDRLFRRFQGSQLVLSYSSNGYPDLETLVALMGRYKGEVQVHQRAHRYHFGTHGQVRRALVEEYLLVGV